MTSYKDGFTKTCARCGFTAVYHTVRSVPGPAVGSGFVGVEPAWVCSSPTCGYYEPDTHATAGAKPAPTRA